MRISAFVPCGLGELEGNLEELRVELAQVRDMNCVLVEENWVFFQALNGLLGSQREMYQRLLGLEGTADRPIVISDSPPPLFVPPPARELLVEIEEGVLLEDE